MRQKPINWPDNRVLGIQHRPRNLTVRQIHPLEPQTRNSLHSVDNTPDSGTEQPPRRTVLLVGYVMDIVVNA